jgi:hypothetical protein
LKLVLAHAVVPFGERAGVLRQVVGAIGDQAVGAAGDGSGRTGIGDEEHRLLGLDLGVGGDGLAKEGLVLLEAGNELLPVSDLKGCVGHGVTPG